MNTYFVLAMISMISAMLLLVLKSCFASKCDDVKCCWGLINIHREVKLEDRELNLQQPTQRRNFAVKVPHLDETSLSEVEPELI